MPAFVKSPGEFRLPSKGLLEAQLNMGFFHKFIL
jgi:hypothetical protein